MTSAISARHVRTGYGQGDVLRGLGFDLAEGELLGVLGPNGCGKSTLIRALTRVINLRSGEVAIRGKGLHDYTRRELARTVAVVPQGGTPLFDFTAFDSVMMGRTPHLGRFERETGEDRRIVTECMVATDAKHLASRYVTDLSGGEYQRVLIARALAQQPRILLLDEPTSHLDINHQIEIFELLLRLRQEQGLTVLCVSHDLNLAAEYCDRVLLMREGEAVYVGAPREAITSDSLRHLYGIELDVIMKTPEERPQVLIRRARRPGGGRSCE